MPGLFPFISNEESSKRFGTIFSAENIYTQARKPTFVPCRNNNVYSACKNIIYVILWLGNNKSKNAFTNVFHNQALVAVKVTVNICLLHPTKRTLSILTIVVALIQFSAFPWWFCGVLYQRDLTWSLMLLYFRRFRSNWNCKGESQLYWLDFVDKSLVSRNDKWR